MPVNQSKISLDGPVESSSEDPAWKFRDRGSFVVVEVCALEPARPDVPLWIMSSNPAGAGINVEELDRETKRILSERDATFDQDRLAAREASEVIADSRRKLKQLTPR